MQNSHCNNNDKKKKTLKKLCGQLDANPGNINMDSKTTVLSTTLRSSMKLVDENICNMLKLKIGKKIRLLSSTMVLFSYVCSYE